MVVVLGQNWSLTTNYSVLVLNWIWFLRQWRCVEWAHVIRMGSWVAKRLCFSFTQQTTASSFSQGRRRVFAEHKRAFITPRPYYVQPKGFRLVANPFWISNFFLTSNFRFFPKKCACAHFPGKNKKYFSQFFWGGFGAKPLVIGTLAPTYNRAIVPNRNFFFLMKTNN